MQLEQRERGFWWPVGSKQAGLKYFYHANDMQTAVNLCAQRRTVIQAGGHIGMWPLWLSSRFKHVHTFEPEPRNFACLQRNTKNTVNIYASNGVLSDHTASVKLRVAGTTGGHNVLSEGGADVHGETAAHRIDDLSLSDVDFIMLDVEGHELPALRGAIETLKACRPVIQFENRGHGEKKGRGDTYDDLSGFLLELGYNLKARVRNDDVWVPK